MFIKKIIGISLIFCLFLLIGCSLETDESDESDEFNKNKQKNSEEIDNSEEKQDSEIMDGYDLLDLAEYNFDVSVNSIIIPMSTCSDTSSTPIVVGDWLVYSLHDKDNQNCDNDSPYYKQLVGYNFEDGKLYSLANLDSSESTAIFVEEKDLLFIPSLFHGGYFVLDASTFEVLQEGNQIQTSSDSAATYLDGSFYLGTVNNPIPLCQDPVKEDCGALFQINANTLDVTNQLDVDDGLRGWMTGSVTTNGEFLFFGTGTQINGLSDEEYLFGCSIVKIDSLMNILSFADPDDSGCHTIGKVESAIVGEIPLMENGLWVQMLGPGDEREKVAVIQYDNDLNEICRAEFLGTSLWGSASFYQAPTIDKDGNAYVSYILPDSTRGKSGYLYKIDGNDCSTTLLHEEFSTNLQSPTLVDDNYVMQVFGSDLVIVDINNGEEFLRYALASDAATKSAPIIYDKVIYVLQVDGTLNVIYDSGLFGYGKAIWPRFRHDNFGTASLVL